MLSINATRRSKKEGNLTFLKPEFLPKCVKSLCGIPSSNEENLSVSLRDSFVNILPFFHSPRAKFGRAYNGKNADH